MSTATKPRLAHYHYPKVYRQLLGYVENHEMHVLLDTGEHRHLLFKSPGTGIGHFSLVTWPGYLAIAGDIGEGFVFCREANMLRWFDYGQPPGHINASYWAEKTSRSSRELRPFSGGQFAKWLREAHPKFKVEGTFYDTLPEHMNHREEAIDYLNDNDLVWDYEDPEQWTDWDHHFLLACHAILWGAKRYHAESERPGGPTDGT